MFSTLESYVMRKSQFSECIVVTLDGVYTARDDAIENQPVKTTLNKSDDPQAIRYEWIFNLSRSSISGRIAACQLNRSIACFRIEF